MIINFNRSANNWVMRHVYKRLQPLQSKLISQSVSMVFLVLWHGLHVGYLINFSFEVPAVLAEQKVCWVRGEERRDGGEKGRGEDEERRDGGKSEGGVEAIFHMRTLVLSDCVCPCCQLVYGHFTFIAVYCLT